MVLYLCTLNPCHQSSTILKNCPLNSLYSFSPEFSSKFSRSPNCNSSENIPCSLLSTTPSRRRSINRPVVLRKSLCRRQLAFGTPPDHYRLKTGCREAEREEVRNEWMDKGEMNRCKEGGKKRWAGKDG